MLLLPKCFLTFKLLSVNTVIIGVLPTFFYAFTRNAVVLEVLSITLFRKMLLFNYGANFI